MKEYIELDRLFRHLNIEIAYKTDFINCGTDLQKGFTQGYIAGLQFAKIVAENNSISKEKIYEDKD